ncbi:MAG: hypothetical protein EAX89_16520 [Candidatus Lokiarchaeota archaeon]|nr:hypothetical protein [Candidatus Lokiarchaeota archaeon]
MILTSSIQVRTNWVNGPYINVLDNTCDVYALNLLIYHDNEWYNMIEKCDFRNFNFYRNFFTFRAKWRFKLHGLVNNELKLLYDEIYDERNKTVAVKFDNNIYECHKDWTMQLGGLANKYNFKPLVISRFSDRLKNEFEDYESHFVTQQEYNEKGLEQTIYAKYNIKRHNVQFHGGDHWESGFIFINNTVPFASFNHRKNWVGMNHEELFNDIMCYE